MENNDKEVEKKLTNDLLEEMWTHANFKPKNPVLTAESIKKDKIRKIINNKIVSYCKVCNCEMYISINYSGEFPLCRQHRDPNDRIK